jgi:Spy/CpxP family protein refolding chaperone
VEGTNRFSAADPGIETLTHGAHIRAAEERDIIVKRLFAAILFLSISAFGQQPPAPNDDPIGRQLFPPEMVMGHQEELALQEKQRAAIRAEVVKVQTRFIDMQWQLSEDTEKMVNLLRGVPVDEAKVLEQADKLMTLERDVKKMQLSMLIRIKNLLTADQIAKLQEIRRKGP